MKIRYLPFLCEENKDNTRIKKQSGLFFICGLGDQERKSWLKKAISITLASHKKSDILKQLKKFDISNSTVYPDFERRTMEIFHQQVKWTPIGKI